MVKYKPYNEQFLKDIENHSMKIEFDDGVHRCLKFSNDDSFNQYFRLTTWPGHLCISGDMGCFVFQRLDDMFEFFRNSAINPGYWGEKLQSKCLFGGYKIFDSDIFKDRVLDFAKGQAESEEHEKEIEESINFNLQFIDNEIDAVSFWRDWDDPDDVDVDFTDFFEVDYTKYSYHYIWCLRAIVWGISKYDDVKKLETS